MAAICKLNTEGSLGKAAKIIKRGGIVVYPTDTLYGFGVDARNGTAVEQLDRLKGRGGPWSILVADMQMLETYALVPLNRRHFVNSQLPGKVTLVLRSKAADLSPGVLGNHGTIGIRIPGHSFPVSLTKQLRFPITSTSVNRTGERPLNDPQEIAAEFGDQVDLIVDGGVLPSSAGSRVIDLSGDGIRIIREGDR